MQNMTFHFNRRARRKEANDLILFWWFLILIAEQQRQIDERLQKLVDDFVNPNNRPPTLG